MSKTNLKDKVIVITGAAQGLGLAMSKRFVQDGAFVIMMDIDPDKLQNAAKELPSNQRETRTCDVTKKSSIDAAFKDIQNVDVLINNAGILRDASLFKMTEEQFDQVMDIHAKGTFLMTQTCAALMKEKQNGVIINLSSVASQGNFGQTNYACAKAGIIGMTKTWALELSRYNIRVNAIAPGLIETEMTASIPDDVRGQMIQRIPFKRMGNPEEIAALACFLASDAASYIQGQVIHINGGYYL